MQFEHRGLIGEPAVGPQNRAKPHIDALPPAFLGQLAIAVLVPWVSPAPVVKLTWEPGAAN